MEQLDQGPAEPAGSSAPAMLDPRHSERYGYQYSEFQEIPRQVCFCDTVIKIL